MKTNFNHYYRIYWAFTQLCNDNCDHCYNSSGPFGTRISEEDCLAVVDNLPEGLEQLIISGGEPLAEKKKLYAILDRIIEKYGDKLYVILQFNGDLLKPKILQTLIDKGVNGFSIASIDRYHKKQGKRKDELSELFESFGISPLDGQPKLKKSERDNQLDKGLTYGFFGATEDMWLGGNWARGRALENDNWKRDPDHNFCAIHSGAIGFLGKEEDDVMQECSIQLWKINPCCPGTHFPLGDARKERVADVLERASKNTVFKILNEGKPLEMGKHLGVSEEEASSKNQELENICLYCDHFMKCHKDEIFDENGVISTEAQNV